MSPNPSGPPINSPPPKHASSMPAVAQSKWLICSIVISMKCELSVHMDSVRRIYLERHQFDVNGSNYQAWVVMVQKALLGTLLRAIDLHSEHLLLSESEDMLLKMALKSTIDDGIKVGVAKFKTGLEVFKMISNTFTACSQTSHLAIVRELLDTHFNLYNKSDNLNSHFRKVENLTKRLTRSGFAITNERILDLAPETR
ncbi:uncharacterized protein VP01_5537g1 [Puccinia sorghi]|uniref:Uncharacterized protein n=1 Tax=Puccinia sorghi TaxID=27349 RepID=A0A0L6ULB8_9BASI|nr:uncharacterized protein VP01_5537g1 [Puccinia sorghi]